MNEIIQNLECNATNGKENFCYISEKKLLAIKELSKRKFKENTNLKQAINEIKKTLQEDLDGLEESKDNGCLSMEQEEQIEFDEHLLQIMDKVLGDGESDS